MRGCRHAGARCLSKAAASAATVAPADAWPVVTAEPPYGGAPVAVSVLKPGGCRVVQKDTSAGTESGCATQLAEVFEGWEQRLVPLESQLRRALPAQGRTATVLFHAE